jgi:hypothetical protein
MIARGEDFLVELSGRQVGLKRGPPGQGGLLLGDS